MSDRNDVKRVLQKNLKIPEKIKIPSILKKQNPRQESLESNKKSLKSGKSLKTIPAMANLYMPIRYIRSLFEFANFYSIGYFSPHKRCYNSQSVFLSTQVQMVLMTNTIVRYVKQNCLMTYIDQLTSPAGRKANRKYIVLFAAVLFLTNFKHILRH